MSKNDSKNILNTFLEAIESIVTKASGGADLLFSSPANVILQTIKAIINTTLNAAQHISESQIFTNIAQSMSNLMDLINNTEAFKELELKIERFFGAQGLQGVMSEQSLMQMMGIMNLSSLTKIFHIILSKLAAKLSKAAELVNNALEIIRNTTLKFTVRDKSLSQSSAQSVEGSEQRNKEEQRRKYLDTRLAAFAGLIPSSSGESQHKVDGKTHAPSYETKTKTESIDAQIKQGANLNSQTTQSIEPKLQQQITRDQTRHDHGFHQMHHSGLFSQQLSGIINMDNIINSIGALCKIATITAPKIAEAIIITADKEATLQLVRMAMQEGLPRGL